MIKNYLERRKALQKLFKENNEGRFTDDGMALMTHKELTFPFRVLLITLCIALLIYVAKC